MENTFNLKQFLSEGKLLKEDTTLRAYQIAKDIIKNAELPEDAIQDKELFLATIKALTDELYNKAADLFSNAGSSPDEY